MNVSPNRDRLRCGLSNIFTFLPHLEHYLLPLVCYHQAW
nr:MAG TPA: hypothetical protein [Caudoviricetes sp.]